MADTLRFAFAGIRHGHVSDLYNAVMSKDCCEIVACCEEDAQTRAVLAEGGKIKVSHQSYDDMLGGVEFDVLALGDVYSKRGAMAIKALEAGKHVMADKPICIKLDEFDRISDLARRNKLCLGLQLDLRSYGVYHTMRKVIREGRIGEVLSVVFTGQHPLMPKVRPGWYFEDGRHGGTINDIAIHGTDLVPWLTGHEIVRPVAARVWNSHCALNRKFQDGAQLVLELDNKAGVMADVSYHSPDHLKGMPPQYWRVTIFGSAGLVETSLTQPDVMVVDKDSGEIQRLSPEPNVTWRYLNDFLACVGGSAGEGMVTTETVLAATKAALEAQRLADA